MCLIHHFFIRVYHYMNMSLTQFVFCFRIVYFVRSFFLLSLYSLMLSTFPNTSTNLPFPKWRTLSYEKKTQKSIVDNSKTNNNKSSGNGSKQRRTLSTKIVLFNNQLIKSMHIKCTRQKNKMSSSPKKCINMS